MESYSSDQLMALLAGKLSSEQEAAIAYELERDPALLSRLERLSGSGIWTIDAAAVPLEITSPSLASAIERVVSESRIERPRDERLQEDPFDVGVADANPSHCKDSMEFAPVVPGIRMVREIGRGGMGVVYEGWDEHVGRKVAIKQLLPMRGSAQTAKERLLREARAAGSLLHPNIVSIYGVHFQNNMPVLVQQYVDGETLQDRIDSKHYLSWQECVEMAIQLASGLEAAHAAGIVHRDLKPDNILIDSATNVFRIADFGIAKQNIGTGLTASDKIAGTPAYMSPEQTSGESLDARSDLFSLGSVVVAALTGMPPFGTDDPFVVMDRIRTQEAKRLREVLPGCPSWLDETVHRLLRKKLAERFVSASGLIAAMQSHALPPNDSSMRSRASRRPATVAAGVGLVGLLGVFLWWFPNAFDERSMESDERLSQIPEVAPANALTNDFVPSKAVGIPRDASEFDSLSDAIESAIDGDVIVVGTDLESESITIRGKKLTIRGTAHRRPILRSATRKNTNENTDGYFIRTETDLTLDGIEIDWIASAQLPLFDDKRLNAVVCAAPGTRLLIDRCKIVRSAGGVCLATGGHLEMRRTTIAGGNIALAWLGHHSQAVVEECVLESRNGIAVVYPLANTTVYTRSGIKLRHCSIRAVDAVCAMLSRRPDEAVMIQLQDTIVDAENAVSLMSLSNAVRDQIESQPIPSLKACLEIADSRCVYNDKCNFVVTRRIKSIERVNRTRVSNIDQWNAILSIPSQSEESRSVIARFSRIPDGSESPRPNRYPFESASEIALPSWVDQVGPKSSPTLSPTSSSSTSSSISPTL